MGPTGEKLRVRWTWDFDKPCTTYRDVFVDKIPLDRHGYKLASCVLFCQDCGILVSRIQVENQRFYAHPSICYGCGLGLYLPMNATYMEVAPIEVLKHDVLILAELPDPCGESFLPSAYSSQRRPNARP